MNDVIEYVPEVQRGEQPTREQFAKLMELDAQFQEIKRQRGFSVVMHNVLAENNMYEIARNAELKVLTVQEQRLLLYLISKITPSDTELKEQVFTVKEFGAVIGFQFMDDTRLGGRNYKIIKDTVKSLASHSMWLYMENGDLVLTRWIDRAEISPGSGTIRIKMDPKLAPYLIGLSQSRRYTSFPLHDILRFRSKYSFPLYEILHANAYKKTIQVPVEKLRKQLGCTAKSYGAFNHFKQRVLDVSIDEINKYSELRVDYETIREKKVVVSVEFHITSLSNSDNEEDRAEMKARYERGEQELNEGMYQQYIKNLSTEPEQFSMEEFDGDVELLEAPEGKEHPEFFSPEWKMEMRKNGVHPLNDDDSPEAWINILQNVIDRIQEDEQVEVLVEEMPENRIPSAHT